MNATITVSDESLSSLLRGEITVRQTLNKHWECQVISRSTLDERPDVEGMLGKPLKVTVFTLETGEHVIFSGFVREAVLIYEVHGSFGVRVEAVSDSWKMDQTPRQAYFKKEPAQQVASSLLSNSGLALTGTIPAGPELTYVQWEESDYRFVERLVDDAEAWMRPAADNPGLEVQTSFQPGPTLIWREGEFGLLEWQTGGRLAPLQQGGVHYDSGPMLSESYGGITSDASFTEGASTMVAATLQGSLALPAGQVADRNRSVTQEAYNSRLQLESRRSAVSGTVCTGISRSPIVRAGDQVTISGLPGVDATYGVIECVHKWTQKGYENEFLATPAQRWFAPKRPERQRLEGIYPARVVDNHDPHNQGRIRVQYWWQTDSASTWVRLLTAHAGADRGILFFPEIGDEVAIAFEESDVERPYIVGSVWNGVQKPPSEGYWTPGEVNGSEFADNNIKRIVTKGGLRITLADNPGQETITLASPRNTRITLTEKANETGRPAIVLQSEGDILFSAPNGRIHFRSATQSRDIGKA